MTLISCLRSQRYPGELESLLPCTHFGVWSDITTLENCISKATKSWNMPFTWMVESKSFKQLAFLTQLSLVSYSFWGRQLLFFNNACPSPPLSLFTSVSLFSWVLSIFVLTQFVLMLFVWNAFWVVLVDFPTYQLLFVYYVSKTDYYFLNILFIILKSMGTH